MEVSQSALARMLGYSFIAGLILGLFYDLLRLVCTSRGQELPPRLSALQARLAVPQRLRPNFLRKKRAARKRSGVLVFAITLVEDVLFCLVAAITLTLVLYTTNDGQMRLSAAVLLVGGLICHRVTLGRSLRFCSVAMIVVARAIVLWLLALVAYPIVTMLHWLSRWTAPLRKRMMDAARSQIRRWQRWYNEKKQQRKVRKAACEASSASQISRPPNGRHYFSSGAKRK